MSLVMRGYGRGRSLDAMVVLGAVRRTGPGRGVHREMVRDADALDELLVVVGDWCS